jgi:hypothetical protein
MRYFLQLDDWERNALIACITTGIENLTAVCKWISAANNQPVRSIVSKMLDLRARVECAAPINMPPDPCNDPLRLIIGKELIQFAAAAGRALEDDIDNHCQAMDATVAAQVVATTLETYLVKRFGHGIDSKIWEG